MTVTATPIFPQSIVNFVVVIPGTTTTQTLASAGTNGTKIESINVSNTSTSIVTISLYVTISSTQYLLSQFSIPASSGNSTSVPSINLLNNTQLPSTSYDSNGNKYLYLANGSSLQATASGTFTGNVTFFSQGGNY
jgi:lipoprotein-anchoring transpeptidase ErfK/SrfK